jgi:hypothetical protein
MIGNAEEIERWLSNQDKDKVFEIKEHKERRSLTANAYAWSLIGKIADVVRSSKDEVYLDMLRKYGQSEMVSVLSELDVDGFFKYYEPIAEVTLQGKRFTHYKIYKGSSEFNSREMAVLIDGIVSEAKELEIETLPPYEVERLKEMWRN